MQINIVPTGHSLEEPESNLAEKLILVFNSGEDSYAFLLTKDQVAQLVEDLSEYGA
jgi:hypothetical protein